MTADNTQITLALKINNLVRRYGKTDAVNGVDIKVKPGRCFGLFGRNGAGKTTTIKCILNHLRPNSGSIKVFGHDPQRDEVAVKARIGYVPENVSLYPWMTVRQLLDYAASFRKDWNAELEKELLERFELSPEKKIQSMSKGMKAQVSLICAVAPEPDMLLLDEPTSGLDPVVRREFIETVIGAYQEGSPETRTVFVSTHLISEFEGLIDEFAIMEHGRIRTTLEADDARERYRKIYLRFKNNIPEINESGILQQQPRGRELELITDKYTPELEDRLQKYSPESIDAHALSLEEIFVAISKTGNTVPC